jgi:Ala-tRNA(Pro) deacylase
LISELREFLIRERAPFEVIDLRDALGASHPTSTRRGDGGSIARVVILRDGDLYALAVLPGAAALDLTGFRRRTGRYALALAKEDEFRGQFPELAVGPLLPFGRLFAIPVYVDRMLAEQTTMVFESSADREVVSMPMSEYVRVERPAIAPLTQALRAA